jgi:hypothetical protein
MLPLQTAEACKKHRDEVITLKDIAEDQKAKIFSLREEKHSLLNKVYELEVTEKQSSDMILRMTTETRELKRELKHLTMKSIGQEEVIREEMHDREAFKSLEVKIRDLQDELFLKDHKLSALEDKIENHEKIVIKSQESDRESLNNQNEDMKVKVETLESKINEMNAKEESDRKKRSLLFQRIDAEMEVKRIDLKNLNGKIKRLNQKNYPECWFGIKCRRLFCKFDHSFIFQKNNKLPIPNPQERVEENPTKMSL